MFLDAPRDGEMQFGLFNYAPLGHYDIRIDQLREEHDREDEWRRAEEMPIHRQEYLGLLRDYEERHEEAYYTSRLYVSVEDGKIELSDETPYFPEHHYREAINGYQDILNRNIADDVEPLLENITDGVVQDQEEIFSRRKGPLCVLNSEWIQDSE